MKRFKNVRLITHTDLDGMGCELIVRLATDERYMKPENKKRYTRVNHDKLDEVVLRTISEEHDPETDLLLITDLCPSDEVVKNLPNGVIVIDHHKSVLYHHNGNNIIIVPEIDGELVSATYLVHATLKKMGFIDFDKAKRFDYLVHCISTWDTFNWKKAESAEEKVTAQRAVDINRLFKLIGYDRLINDILLFRYEYIQISPSMIYFSDKSQFALDLESARNEIEFEMAIKNMKSFSFEGLRSGLVINPPNLSMTCDHILSMTDVEILFVLTPYGVSMRSRNHDVSKIAKRFNGGGHVGAAGFNITTENFISMFNNLFGELETNTQN
ncbi:MAG: DHHA1 domain-containing protein [Paraclostridium sp.]